jgi:hypothetical protein
MRIGTKTIVGTNEPSTPPYQGLGLIIILCSANHALVSHTFPARVRLLSWRTLHRRVVVTINIITEESSIPDSRYVAKRKSAEREAV